MLISCRGGWAAAPTATTRPTTRPDDARVIASLDEVAGLIEVGDRRAAATILHWLGSEQDRTRVGSGSQRLRLAVRGAERLHLVEAVPYLVAVYDAPTATVGAKNIAAGIAIRLAPARSKAFLEEVLSDDGLAVEGFERMGHYCAAGAMVELGDQRGRAFLLEAYRGFLETKPAAPQPGEPRRGRRAQPMNANVVFELSHLADAELADGVAALAKEYSREDQREHIEAVAEQIRANARPADELLKLAEQEIPRGADKESEQASEAQLRAVGALGFRGGADVAPALEALQRRLAEAAKKVPAEPAGATRPAPTTAPAAKPPSTPAQRLASKRTMVERSLATLRKRHGLPAPPAVAATTTTTAPATSSTTAPATVPATRPATRPDAEPLDGQLPLEGASVLRFSGIGTFTAGGHLTAHAEFIPVDGNREPVRLRVKEQETVDLLSKLPSEAIVLATRADEGTSIDRIVPLDTAPGENSPYGYVFVESRRVRSGPWEHLAAVMRKLGREVVARVPNRTAADGSTVSERRLAEQLARLRPGDVVEARTQEVAGLTMLWSIVPYEPSLPARFVALTNVTRDGKEHRAVELSVARERTTFLLPSADDSDGPPLLTPDLLDALRPGFRVRFTPGTSADAPLRALWLDGYIYSTETARGGERFLAHSDRASLQGENRKGERTGWILTGGRDGEASRLSSGTAHLLNQTKKPPKDFPPEKVALLRPTSQGNPHATEPEKERALVLYKQWEAAEKDERMREEIEQQIFLILQQVTERVELAERERIENVRKLLTESEYQAVLDLGRTEPKPRLRPEPKADRKPGEE